MNDIILVMVENHTNMPTKDNLRQNVFFKFSIKELRRK